MKCSVLVKPETVLVNQISVSVFSAEVQKALEQNRQKFSFSEGVKMNRHTYQLFVNGRLIHRSRRGKDAFRNFDSYTPGDWFNYPAGERVRQVQLIRDDGMIQDKGQEAT